MKIIITETQQKNLHQYLRRIDGLFYEYLQENWPPEELCNSPYADVEWNVEEYGEMSRYFVENNMKSIAVDITSEMVNVKYNTDLVDYDSFKKEYVIVMDILKQVGYEEKLELYLYSVIEKCHE